MSRNGISEPEQRLPIFLADEDSEQGIGSALSRSAISSRVLKAIAWVTVPVALGIAALSVDAPAKLVSDLTASISEAAGSLLGHAAAPQAGTDNAAPVIRYAAADAQGLPPAAVDTLAREDMALVPGPDQHRAENGEPPSEGLLGQFQAWAADKPAQTPAEPVASVPDAPVPVAQEAPSPIVKEAQDDTREPTRSVHKRRHGKALQNARAEMRPAHLRRKKIPLEQYSRAADRPAQEARVPEQGQAAQPAQAPAFQTAPSFFQTLGFGTQQ